MWASLKPLSSHARQYGFTIVELLIVIVVIGILAAITMVTFGGVQNRAYDTSVQNDLKNIAKQIEIYKVLQSGVLPAGLAQLTTLEITVSKSAYGNHYNNGSGLYNLLYCRPSSGDPNLYALVAMGRSGNGFQYGSASGLAPYTGTWSGGGSGSICAAVGVTNGGVTAYRDWFFDDGAWQPFVGGS